VPGQAGEPVLVDPAADVGVEDPAVPVDHRVDGDGGTEPGRVADHPAGQDAATAAAGDVELLGVDEAPGDHGIDAGVQIVEVVPRVGVVDQVAELGAV